VPRAPSLTPVGSVESPLKDRAAAPKQGDEGAPAAWIVVSPRFRAGLEGIEEGDELLVVTWLHLADRDTTRVHPRDDRSRPAQGVFATRSADRPNPIGLHRVRVRAIDAERLHVDGLEAVDGTPVVDLKPVLSAKVDER
jgi:tRNA-Thr(GGU) m(6)t(6)A37 methyltransferase TsaA